MFGIFILYIKNTNFVLIVLFLSAAKLSIVVIIIFVYGIISRPNNVRIPYMV